MIIDKNAQCYFNSAKSLFLPVKAVEEINGFELKLGKKHYLFRGCETPFNNISSASIASDKYCTNQLLEKAGIPVPKAISLSVFEFKEGKTEEKISKLEFPLVIKPLLNGSRGIDVLCNIQTLGDLKTYLSQYFLSYNHLIIEEFHGKLKSYRVLVFNRRVIGIVIRHPASVIGDGRHTIEELVDLANLKRQETSDALGPIEIDEECLIRLKELGLHPYSIPAQNEKIVLCYTSNATRGGTFESLDLHICKFNRQLMVKIASVLNITLAGIDVECHDLNMPLNQSGGVILEVNHRPSVRIHELPSSGKSSRVTKEIMKYFIYKHPLSYLKTLYLNQPTAFYMRTILLIFAVIIFFYLAKL